MSTFCQCFVLHSATPCQTGLAKPRRCCWVRHKEGSRCHTRLVDDGRHASDNDSQDMQLSSPDLAAAPELCLVMSHRVLLVPSLVYGWITATLCIRACQTLIFKGYRECRTLLHELFAKLHDANITQLTFLRISIGYRCVAESTTRLPSSDIKPSNYKNLRIWLVYLSKSCVLRSSTSDLLSKQPSSTNTVKRQFSCCIAPLEQSSLICMHWFRSLLKTLCLQDISNNISSPMPAEEQ